MIILDIDGTLADGSHRLHLIKCDKPDWKAFISPELMALDTPIEGALRVMPQLISADYITLLTGRNESLRDVTQDWLKKHFDLDTDKENLLMRDVGDTSPPSVYKRSRLKKITRNLFDEPWYAFDDDPYMVSVYKEFNIVSFLAPKCWDSMFVETPNLPPEQYWRA